MSMGVEEKLMQAALLMEKAGLKPYVVGPKIGISGQAVYDWVNGAHRPRKESDVDKIIAYVKDFLENNESSSEIGSRKRKVSKGGMKLIPLRKNMGRTSEIIEVPGWEGDYEREAVEISDFAMAPRVGYGWTAIYEVRRPSQNDVVAVRVGEDFSARVLIGQGESATLCALGEGFPPIPIGLVDVLGPIMAVRFTEPDGAVHDIAYPKGMKHNFEKLLKTS